MGGNWVTGKPHNYTSDGGGNEYNHRKEHTPQYAPGSWRGNAKKEGRHPMIWERGNAAEEKQVRGCSYIGGKVGRAAEGQLRRGFLMGG